MAHFKAAVRSLIATPGPTLVVIATLAIAIGANTAIFSVVSGVILRPLGYADDARLVVLWAQNASDDLERFRLSPADYRDVRDDTTAFDGSVVLYRSIGSTLTALDEPVRVGSMTVTSRLFRVLGVRPALGNFFTDADEVPGAGSKVIITHECWTRRFGADPAIVGSTIELEGSPFTVIGVTESGFQFPPGQGEFEIYFPMGLTDAVLLDRSHRMFDAIARLGDDRTLDEARAELSVMAARLAQEYPDTNAGWSLTATPLREELFSEISTTMRVLSGAVFVVLLIACANVANVLAARSIAGHREFAVRAALGARPIDLCKRSLAESGILGVLGFVGGLMLALWGVLVLRNLIPVAIPRGETIEVDLRVLAFSAVLSLGATVLFGALPALRSIAPNVLDLVKSSGAVMRTPEGSHRTRASVVVAEVALAVVLLVCAGLMVRSFEKLSRVDPGFRQSGVVAVAVRLPRSSHGRTEWRDFFMQLVERVKETPGIRTAGAVSDLPMHNVGLGFELEFTVVGLDALSPTERPNADIRLVLPGYYDAMGMSIARGRAFDAIDATSGRRIAIVNETLVDRYFRNAGQDIDPIGRTLRLEILNEVEIVGVVSNVRHGGLQSKHESEIYIPYGTIATAEMHIVAQSDLQPSAVASSVGAALSQMAPNIVPAQAAAMSDLLSQSVAEPRFNTTLLGGLALAAALLAIVGTYGIVAYSVSVRTSEIGVRMALGADSASTVTMIVRQALAIVLGGVGLGLLGALGATQVMRSLLFEVQPTDPLTYGVVLSLSVLVGVLAAWIPARRATGIDPVAALRRE